MRTLYSFILAAFVAIGVVAVPGFAGTALADDCGTIAARIAVHNAKPSHFTQAQAAQYYAYEAEANALEAEQARCQGKPKPKPPPRPQQQQQQQQQQQAPPKQNAPPKPPRQPEPVNDPGLMPLRNGVAAGYKNRLRAADIKPPNADRYDMSRANPRGWNDLRQGDRKGFQRGHLRADVLGGSGSDPRNFVLLTSQANTQMRSSETAIANYLRKNPDPDYWVDYQAIPVYGNGYSVPPTAVTMSAIDKNGTQLIPPSRRTITNYTGTWPPP